MAEATAELVAEATEHFWNADGTASRVWDERRRQIDKWGIQERDGGTSHATWGWLEEVIKLNVDLLTDHELVTWADILLEEVVEAFAEENPEKLAVELVQVIAVCESWLLDMARRPSG